MRQKIYNLSSAGCVYTGIKWNCPIRRRDPFSRMLRILKFRPQLKIRFVRSTRSSVVSESRFVIRRACAKDMDFVTRQTIKEGWHVGPYDFPNAFAFDPKRFFVGAIDNKVVGHVCAITYPNHHSHMGACIVAEEYRGKGYGKKLYCTSYDISDKKYTVGGEMDSKIRPWFEAKGFQVFWNTYVAMLSLEKVAKKLSRAKLPFPVTIKPTNIASLSSLLDYDSFVFGTSRHAFIKRWITTPGSFGLVAVKDGNIVGYSILRQVIRGGGTEIGLAMAPLFADNVDIAKALIKTAAEKCLANEAVPNAKLELIHPVGKNCGEGSSELMEELEAELTHIAFRMYSKEIPPGRKIGNIYGIASPTFD